MQEPEKVRYEASAQRSRHHPRGGGECRCGAGQKHQIDERMAARRAGGLDQRSASAVRPAGGFNRDGAGGSYWTSIGSIDGHTGSLS